MCEGGLATESLKQIAGNLSKVYERVARSAFPHGVATVCNECGKSRLMTTEEAAVCLAVGWPKCCERTMGVEAIPYELPPLLDYCEAGNHRYFNDGAGWKCENCPQFHNYGNAPWEQSS